MFRFSLAAVTALSVASRARAADALAHILDFFSEHCVACDDADCKKGGIDLAALPWKPSDTDTFNRWVKVFEKVDKQKARGCHR
jgi:hypothetical protein